MRFQSLDIFCHVVDNFGDIGFVYRFAREFQASHPYSRIRVFVDDLNALCSVNPGVDPAKTAQHIDNIEYVDSRKLTDEVERELDIADVLVEAFACHIPENVLKAAESRPRVIINLEHLSAEAWVDGYHLKPSLLSSVNLTKYFFMPGFTAATGGVIVDPRIKRTGPRLAERRDAVLRCLLRQAGAGHIDNLEDSLVGTVFTYERGFDNLVHDLNGLHRSSILLVFGEKSGRGMARTLERAGGCRISEHCYTSGKVRVVFMPFMAQPRYDALLYCTDFNIVRGEDSLVRALLAARPYIWNAYLQDEKYQKVKVEALLLRMEKYFTDNAVYSDYRDLMLSFNDAGHESSDQVTGERYHTFFTNLTKIEHATREMSYFLARNCDLIGNFSRFIDSL